MLVLNRVGHGLQLVYVDLFDAFLRRVFASACGIHEPLNVRHGVGNTAVVLDTGNVSGRTQRVICERTERVRVEALHVFAGAGVLHKRRLRERLQVCFGQAVCQCAQQLFTRAWVHIRRQS